MAANIRAVEYFNAHVADRPGSAYGVLSRFADAGVNLLAFSVVPTGPGGAQLVLFPEDGGHLEQIALALGLELEGPHQALLVQGDDELGALARLHQRLAGAGINVFASSGVTDGHGGYGYIIHVRPGEFAAARRALGV